MIRKFVLVNKNVTDFHCVLEFMDITGSCTVFGHLVGPFIFISSKTKRLKNDYRFEDKLLSSQKAAITFKTEKLKGHVGSGCKKSEISCNVNWYKYLLIIN